MLVLLPALPFSNALEVDPDFSSAQESATRCGLSVGLIDFEELLDGNIIRAIRKIPEHYEAGQQTAVLRSWMLAYEPYTQLYTALFELKRIALINSPTQYQLGHEFPGWYETMHEFTPESIIVPGLKPDIAGFVSSVIGTFTNGPILIKDYVKSRKHEWLDACYIPDVANIANLQRVVSNFVERQGADLVGGLIARRFVALKEAANNSRAGMPIPWEWRIFRIAGSESVVVDYWIDELSRAPDVVLLSVEQIAKIIEATDKLDTNFCAVDVALTTEGSLIVIEVGDGQVSDIRDETKLDHLMRAFQHID